VSVHLLLAQRGHVLDLLVVALDSLLIFRDLLGIQKLVGGGVLGEKKIDISAWLWDSALNI